MVHLQRLCNNLYVNFQLFFRVMDTPKSVPELMEFVQATLTNMQDKFQHAENSIVKRLNDTAKKIDEIEKGLTDLMDHSGMGEPFEDDAESEKESEEGS